MRIYSDQPHGTLILTEVQGKLAWKLKDAEGAIFEQLHQHTHDINLAHTFEAQEGLIREDEGYDKSI